ncbi:hypothetical protein ACOMCU_00270 [Lysinibacillus sp. UGB7]|uniref:hypothetical protein n=1 Tax=Lysinibacillus sp. UGB7 TaxID=3411039 RepID=UPI003B7B2FEE
MGLLLLITVGLICTTIHLYIEHAGMPAGDKNERDTNFSTDGGANSGDSGSTGDCGGF